MALKTGVVTRSGIPVVAHMGFTSRAEHTRARSASIRQRR